jgi:hypothetical protein
MIKRKLGTIKFTFGFRLVEITRPIDHLINTVLRKKYDTKIFCIGEVKTGTTSLYHALKILGIRTARLFKITNYYRGTQEEYISIMKKYRYDAYTDFPMGANDLYKKIDKAFPGSKFILTIREEEAFKKSYYNFYKNTQLHKSTAPEKLNDRVKRTKERNEKIIKYFEKRKDQLLVINITEGNGWEKLCPFLNKPIPKKAFPHSNIGKYRKKQVTKEKDLK